MSIPAPSGHRRLLVLALLGLVACSSPPRGTRTDPDQPLPPPPSDQKDRKSETTYDFEREGQFPAPASDVVFEEDQLPPRPENVDAAPLDGRDVHAADLAEPTPAQEPAERVPSVETPVAPSVSIPVEGAAVPMRMGFRVQLIAAADRTEAETFAREARARLGISVHVDFEAPYYKVRAGDFLDRADALAMRDRARANGYEGAWVTATRVKDSGDSGS